MKLLFFIRNIDLAGRGFQFDDERVGDLHELVYCREGAGTLAAGGSGREGAGSPAAGGSGAPSTAGATTGIGVGHLLFNPRGRLTAAPSGMSISQILFSEELFSPSVPMDKEALYVLGLIKLHARRQNLIALSRIGSERMTTLMDAMLWEFQNRYRGYSWAIRLKLVELLITVMRDSRFNISIKSLKPLANSRIQDAVLYVNAEYMNPITVDDVLESCALSRSHFHALFKQETGRTFVDYLNGLRCERAAELLATSEKPIIEVAGESGFNNLSHFYHLFRRMKGMSPRSYRTSVTQPAYSDS